MLPAILKISVKLKEEEFFGCSSFKSVWVEGLGFRVEVLHKVFGILVKIFTEFGADSIQCFLVGLLLPCKICI